MGDTIDARMRFLGKAIEDRFAMEGDEEFEDAYGQAQDAGREESEVYAETLGSALSAQCVAMGAMRLAFDADGAGAVKEAMRDLQEAVDEWTKEPE